MENNDVSKKNSQKELKHLGFVRVAAINTMIWLSNVYDYAKQNSGPLKSAVDTVEGAVTTVVTPVYDKFKDVPDHLLDFLDEKVDDASAIFDEHAPPLAKRVASEVHSVIHQTTQLAKEVIHQAQLGGPLAAAQYAAHESTALILKQSVKVYSKLDQFPPFHIMAEMMVPTAAHWSEKYNKVVVSMRESGHGVFKYVLMVPVEEISKEYKQLKSANEEDGGSSGSSSEGEGVVSE